MLGFVHGAMIVGKKCIPTIEAAIVLPRWQPLAHSQVQLAMQLDHWNCEISHIVSNTTLLVLHPPIVNSFQVPIHEKVFLQKGSMQCWVSSFSLSSHYRSHYLSFIKICPGSSSQEIATMVWNSAHQP